MPGIIFYLGRRGDNNLFFLFPQRVRVRGYSLASGLVINRVPNARFGKAFQAQATRITAAAGDARLVRGITGMRQGIVHAKSGAAANNLSFRHVDQRRVNPKVCRLFHARLRRQVGQVLEGRNELRPAIRVPGVVNRIDADEQVSRSHRFSITKSKR